MVKEIKTLSRIIDRESFRIKKEELKEGKSKNEKPKRRRRKHEADI